MEYIVFFGAFLVFLIFIFIKGAFDAGKNRKKFEQKLHDRYGFLPEKEYKIERFSRIDSYFNKHRQDGQIDDITWNDLNMDEVFKQMNHTLSSTGEEYLYYTLRTPKCSVEELAHMDEMADYFDQNEKRRVSVQMLFKALGSTGNYSLYDYLDYLGNLGQRSNLKYYIRILLLLFMIVICFFQFSIGIFGIVILVAYNIIAYFKEKGQIEPYIVSFAYVIRLLQACDRIVGLSIPVCEKEWEIIRQNKTKLSAMRRGSSLVMSGNSGSTGGNPLEILVDYLKMAFHVDIIIFNRMLAELNKHIDAVDVLVEELGKIETAICIASYRASIEKELENNWCKPQFTAASFVSAGNPSFTGQSVILEEAYHPLLHHPVKNSISTDKGVLLTGSNASGKSTFLKTVALNAILAQTIYTCPADQYKAPFFHILSSMALKDDLGSGESYYIVEIKALKRILDASLHGNVPVLCIVDEVLRGTNTVERIAASTQILKSLTGGNIICFAATHDIELTELLKEEYHNYHFEEEIQNGDIYFNYKLLTGKATTRNAIKLLELLGYDNHIIEKATKQAELFLISGRWDLKFT